MIRLGERRGVYRTLRPGTLWMGGRFIREELESLAAAVPLVTVSGVLSSAMLSQVVALAAAVAWGPDMRVLVPAVVATRAGTCTPGLLLSLRVASGGAGE